MGETSIHAVEMVREIRDAMYEETKGMTEPEYIAYLARRSAAVRTSDAADPKRTGGRSAA